MRAFTFLVWSTWRNRLVSQARRVRSPRYAMALLVGGLYLWWFFFRPTRQANAAAGMVFLGRPMQFLAVVFVVLSTLGTWVFGSDRSALAFSQAEVALLFPAPLSRRALIGYKLFRAQIVVLINALIWVFIIRRGGTALPSPLRAVGLWVMFSTLNLHRLGAALVRASWSEHRAAGARRHAISIALLGVVVAAVAYSLFLARQQLLAASGPSAMFGAALDALAIPPASVAMYPFRAVIAPTFARSIADWTHAMGPAVIVLALHVWWIFQTDRAFEEAAVEASAERARRLEAFRQRRGMAAVPRAKSHRTVRLGATGHPALAIVWKNTLCLLRTAQVLPFLMPAILGAVFGLSVSGGHFGPARTVAACAGSTLVALFFLGWRLIRNDLRHDMANLPLLKTLPISSSEIVLAEVASATLPLVVVELALVAITYIAAELAESPPFSPPLTAPLRLMILLVAPAVLIALNGALLTIQNATAVLFPGWIRIGPTVTGGVEALGQNVLSFAGAVICLGVALIVPTFVGGMVFAALNDRVAVGLGAALILGSIVLAAETYGVMRLLGRAFDRAEPLATN
jgi:ABC-2 type transport system permease protein